MKVQIGGAAAQLELRGVADKRTLYLVAEVVKSRAGISSMAEGTSGRIGEEGGERAEEEGDGGAECGVMESSVDAPLQEAQFTPAQMEAMHVEMSRRIVPLQQRYERAREQNVALQAAQRRSLAFTMEMVQRQLDQRQQGPAAPRDVGVDLHATSFVKLCPANLPYSLTTLSNASMSLDVGVDRNATIMAKLRQAQQQFPHQIDNCGHANKSVDQKATIFANLRQAHQQLQQHIDHASAARVQHQQERDRIQQEHFNREGNIAYFQHVGLTPSFDITRTGALRPALRANAQRIQLLHATTLLQSIVRRRLVRASTAGTRLSIEAMMEQLELMRMRHAARHSSSQRSVLQGMAATTIQRAWRRRGTRLALQHVPATNLVQSTSQVVRGCVSFFTSCVQQASKVLTRARDAPAFALGAVATMTHFISASRQLQQQIKVRQQAVISLQATVRRRLAKAQQNCSAKGWRHCVPLTDRMIQGYTLAQLVKCSREAVTLQPACEPVAGVSIFTKRQAPTTNGG